ncbi:four-carbon acid sugar kinase family protein [Desmospora activa]|uniref:Uncharacterized protein YgbK (DUF1537 family) n=1 Tax=Desmospora activa DSM 45169 TaxID=1121389 RepID=A0A2T4Z3U0_9BACL|nr:four-carbon acid sugar kinase family protein [Desmospora activa]PTM56552.1 uncharacterized protein YgbK (DUF1537 family) [Desmospora activa DSM 45169]
MRIAVIADDITGANDCGGQLIPYGYEATVMLEARKDGLEKRQAVIFNTDSRSVSEADAYQRVKATAEWVKAGSFDVIYKKIDSTMRGNIGQEINAIHDVFHPDFVLIAPSYPENGRRVVGGIHYVNNQRLSETEFGQDPKTPVHESDIRNLIKSQSKRNVGHISIEELRKGIIAMKLSSFKKQGISYIVVDAIDDSDLKTLAHAARHTPYTFVCAGSSGLLKQLPASFGVSPSNQKHRITVPAQPALLVIGSVSRSGREQLAELRQMSSVTSVEINPQSILQGAQEKEREIQRVTQVAADAFANEAHVALYSSDDVANTQKFGKEMGYTPIAISDLISSSLGEIAAKLINRLSIRRLFLTGGDTAYQVFNRLHATQFQLLDEVEPGVPIGRLDDDRNILAVTKAGNFGSPQVMVKALKVLIGNEESISP